MKEYFTLQFKMCNRQLTEWGIEPIIGYGIGIAAFAGLSSELFLKTEYAAVLYFFLSFSIALKLNEAGRNDFLKLCFSKYDYTKLRMLENAIAALPFTVFLTYKQLYPEAFLLLLSTCGIIFLNAGKHFNFTIPTPFSKQPFEFTVGFRNTFWIYPMAYFLTYIAIHVGNFNLGLFAMMLPFFACLNYYTIPENEFYVWIFSLNPREFLMYKFKTIMLYAGFLSLPIATALCLYNFHKIDTILTFVCLGYLFVLTTMLAKYSVFPDKLTIRFAIVFAMVIWLPPLLLLIIPYLYVQATKNLSKILQ